MNEIWVVSQTVDLGSHTICAYQSELNAIGETKRLNSEYKARQRKSLVDGFGYSEEQFEREHKDMFFYEAVSVFD